MQQWFSVWTAWVLFVAECMNIYILLLISIVLVEVALVFLLLVCKLTAATGTISDLVFCQYCRMSNVPSKYQFILC